MGFSRYAVPQQGIIVRTGAERATLVRRTYSLVFASILVTIAGTGLRDDAAAHDGVRWSQHPFITFLCVFAPMLPGQ